MEILDVWLEPKVVRAGYITGHAEVELKGTIKLINIQFVFNAAEGDVKIKLPPNVDLGEYATRKLKRAITEELVDEVRLGLIQQV